MLTRGWIMHDVTGPCLLQVSCASDPPPAFFFWLQGKREVGSNELKTVYHEQLACKAWCWSREDQVDIPCVQGMVVRVKLA